MRPVVASQLPGTDAGLCRLHLQQLGDRVGLCQPVEAYASHSL